MPSEQTVTAAVDSSQSESTQAKLCADCHGPLALDSSSIASYLNPVDTNEMAMVCSLCRERMFAGRLGYTSESPVAVPSDGPLNIDVARGNESWVMQADNQSSDGSSMDSEMDIDQQRQPTFSRPNAQMLPRHRSHTPPGNALAAVSPTRQERPHLQRDVSSNSSSSRLARSPTSPVDAYPSPASATGHPHVRSSVYSPDPTVDITRLRVPSLGRGCLFPGATFQGTQKSGRNSYDVNVTIVVSA